MRLSQPSLAATAGQGVSPQQPAAFLTDASRAFEWPAWPALGDCPSSRDISLPQPEAQLKKHDVAKVHQQLRLQLDACSLDASCKAPGI